MNPTELNNLINAYLDGELSDSKCKKVEALIEKDEDARAILNELNRVHQMVTDLPQMKAPSELAEAVLYDLERDVLLPGQAGFNEAAGHKHLRLRRWLETAAMVILVGAIVLIVYNVLHDNQVAKQNDAARTEPLVLLDGSSAVPELPGMPDSVSTSMSPSWTTSQPLASRSAEMSQASEVTIADNLHNNNDDLTANNMMEPPVYGSIQLIVNYTPPEPLSLKVQDLIYSNNILQVISNIQDPANPQFAFICSDEQFNELYQGLQEIKDVSSMQVVLEDKANNRDIILECPSREEVLQLATEANHDVQIAQVMQIQSRDRVRIIDTCSKSNDRWYRMLVGTSDNQFASSEAVGNGLEVPSRKKTNYGTRGGSADIEGGLHKKTVSSTNSLPDRKTRNTEAEQSLFSFAETDKEKMISPLRMDRFDANEAALSVGSSDESKNAGPSESAMSRAGLVEKNESSVHIRTGNEANKMDRFQMEAESQKVHLIAVELLVQALNPANLEIRKNSDPLFVPSASSVWGLGDIIPSAVQYELPDPNQPAGPSVDSE